MSLKHINLTRYDERRSSNSVLSNIKTIQERYNFDDPDWKNIRIKLNYDYITGNLRDPQTCYEEDQQIQVGSETIACDKNKVVSNMDLTNFTITMNNLKTFLENFLKVIPTPNKDYDFEYIIKLPQYKSSSSTIADANILEYDKLRRPLKSDIKINPAKI
ncbi:hypothetical protein TVAG_030930 [Trichomonas vaginalis G3]|uniref:Uncharacterized protein n=1 Tax=Trichomonas vaginalis (strain ATCC PRA-98 / G3) TaxID=412133 RepID=A2EYK1_TRIV3|nr:regulation of choline O-acetyltransferase protein [Trichomonas vaginalis G3]EAY02277.1 hypothetical protein TVAG_030930 [Trichomonas vaginalis G3]KAI5522896.1 regulation of choline O-acetyltransferase protein [Trichomonas vaginalis G3]|eukprot:XP_001314594.1 hypothetical protein [Trichomonas vaginalis G3]